MGGAVWSERFVKAQFLLGFEVGGVCFVSEIKSCCVVQAVLKLAILLPQPPRAETAGMLHCTWYPLI